MVELATKFSLPPERRFRASPRCESIGDSRQGALTRRSPLPRLFTLHSCHGGHTNMDQITKPSTNGTRFAVSRVYQPARIERELLAQIFDLVERGVRQDFEPGGATQERVVIATRVRSTDQVVSSIVSINNASRTTELEDVA